MLSRAVRARGNDGDAPHREARQLRHRCGASSARRLPLTGCIAQTTLLPALALPLLSLSSAVRCRGLGLNGYVGAVGSPPPPACMGYAGSIILVGPTRC